MRAFSHVDVSSDVNGNNVKAILHKAYNGGKIVLDGVSLSQESDPDLMRYIGSDIITSDGTSLLGSDDKAGIAIIMEALKYLSEHKEIEHGDIEVYFTPDEETGSGMDMFPYDRLKSYVTYTVDGEEEDVIETECFNASSVELEFRWSMLSKSHPRSFLCFLRQRALRQLMENMAIMRHLRCMALWKRPCLLFLSGILMRGPSRGESIMSGI